MPEKTAEFITAVFFAAVSGREKMKIKDNRVRYFIYAAFFMLFVYLGYKVPYCHDEWKWGLPQRVELMKRGFSGYNGRYLGNILALLITRSEVAKTLVISVCMVLIVWLMEMSVRRKTFSEKDKSDPILLLSLILLLLAVPASLYGQSYGWPAAFVNYEVPVPLFLVYFIWTDELYRNKVEKYSWFQTLAVIPLGICVQLFSENITIIVVAYAVWMMIYTGARYRKIYLIEVNYLWSAILGAVVMFSNSAYFSAAVHNGKTYKSIDMSAGVLLQRFVVRIWTNLVLNNWVLTVILAVLLTALILKKRKQSFAAAEMLVVFWGYSVYSIFHRICPEWTFDGNQAVDRGIMALLSMLFFINVLLCIWMFTEKEERISICITYLGSLAFAAPLIAADPIGPRCFYISYVFEVLTAAKILQYFLKNRGEIQVFYPALILAVTVCISAVFYVRIFMIIGKYSDYRAELIEEAVEQNAEELTLPVMPFSDYTGYTEPIDEIWNEKFKEFYHIPENMTVRFE